MLASGFIKLPHAKRDNQYSLWTPAGKTWIDPAHLAVQNELDANGTSYEALPVEWPAISSFCDQSL
jgi:hypothetical protein